MAWKARFVQFSWQACCFYVLVWISVRWAIFGSGRVGKCHFAKTSSAWPEKHVLYKFHGNATIFTYWRGFQFGERFLDLERWKMRFGQNVLRMAWKAPFVQFSRNSTCLTYWRAIQSGKAILRNSNRWPQIERDELREVHSGYCWKHLRSSISSTTSKTSKTLRKRAFKSIYTITSIAIMAGGAVLNAATFIGGNYLARFLSGDDPKAAQ